MGIHVFLNDAYADWELGYILPELASPPAVPGIKKNIRKVVTFGLNDSPVQSMGSLRVSPQKTIEQVELSQIEALILPGGLFWEKFENPMLDTLVRSLVDRGVLVAGICAATGYLARWGILDGVDHTSNSLAFLKMCAPNYKGEAHYKNELAVLGKGIVTASKRMSGIALRLANMRSAKRQPRLRTKPGVLLVTSEIS